MAQPLRRQVFFLNIAVLVPVFVAAGWSVRETYQEQLRQLESEARSLAGSLLVYIDRGLEMNEVQTVITTLPLPTDAVIAVTDSRNVVLARSDRGEDFAGEPTDATPQPAHEVPAVVIRAGSDGVERVYANYVHPRGPWLVSAGIPTALARERMEPLIRRNLVIALAATWLTILLEFLLLRPYKRAFDTATGVASSVAAGDLSRPATMRMPSEEMERLQSTLVTMVDRLRDARAELDAQVAEERRIRLELQSLQRQVIRQERLAAIGVLASGLAHELNNPLQGILGSVELLQMRTDLALESRTDLAMIQKESARASAIIRNLSRFSRQQPAEAGPVCLREVTESVLELRRRKLQDQEIELVVEHRADPRAVAVFEELQQVVLNLLINAEQALAAQPPPRRIAIRVDRIGARARLEVEDNGPGVPRSHEQQLFQPFFTTKPVGEGTGLGLSVSYGIIESYGGTIGYASAEGGGSVFYFELPVADQGP